jgi:hypothetical protein
MLQLLAIAWQRSRQEKGSSTSLAMLSRQTDCLLSSALGVSDLGIGDTRITVDENLDHYKEDDEFAAEDSDDEYDGSHENYRLIIGAIEQYRALCDPRDFECVVPFLLSVFSFSLFSPFSR